MNRKKRYIVFTIENDLQCTEYGVRVSFFFAQFYQLLFICLMRVCLNIAGISMK